MFRDVIPTKWDVHSFPADRGRLAASVVLAGHRLRRLPAIAPSPGDGAALSGTFSACQCAVSPPSVCRGDQGAGWAIMELNREDMMWVGDVSSEHKTENQCWFNNGPAS